MSDLIKKNLLDLSYNKYLQYFTTCVILIFTYIIGLIIALLSKQVNYNSFAQISFVLFISAMFLVPIALFMKSYKTQLNRITEEIKTLNL